MPDSHAGDKVTFPPIGAMFRGPGPGRYMLPTTCSYQGHDFTKHRKPAASFGLRHLHALTNDCSPGPKYLQDARITRTGLEGNPKYSLLGNARFEQLSKLNVPGPGEIQIKRFCDFFAAIFDSKLVVVTVNKRQSRVTLRGSEIFFTKWFFTIIAVRKLEIELNNLHENIRASAV